MAAPDGAVRAAPRVAAAFVFYMVEDDQVSSNTRPSRASRAPADLSGVRAACVRTGRVLREGATNEHEQPLQDAAQQRPRARGAARRSSSSSSSTCCAENAVLFVQLAGGLALLAHF